ncbi:hypothetical protein [Desertivibrio insolitus]|uniref:hypothetical protein n=1 Tax=Herbiconiux sp. SYSU D00978 TaxID=2812562 RepID=UPI001A96BF2C|nr:hypothetical protein [Herbiconiux sp. SYSU D00978]
MASRRFNGLLLTTVVLSLSACASAPASNPSPHVSSSPSAETDAVPTVRKAAGATGGRSSKPSPAPALPEPTPIDVTPAGLPDCDHLLPSAVYEHWSADGLEPLYEQVTRLSAEWVPHAVLLTSEDSRLCLWGEQFTDYSFWYGIGTVSAAESDSVITALLEAGYDETEDSRGHRVEYFGEGPYGGMTSPHLITPEGYLLLASSSDLLDDLYEATRDHRS